MRSFACDTCGQLVFFEITVCLRCGSDLGFEPRRRELVTLSAGAARCANLELAACNWLVDTTGKLCASCVLTRTRPADDDTEGMERFRAAEAAERWLLFELDDLYPFVLPAPVVEKPAFVHERVTAASRPG